MSNETVIWNFLRGKGLFAFGNAGVMGNLYAESGLIPNNLQNNFEASLGMSDVQYTQAVDNGSYTNFVYDAAGYGLAQWTFWSRKQGLLNLAMQMGKSVGDLNVQLEFLWKELQDFGLVDKLNACQSVKEASNLILFEFEKPFDTGPAVQNARAECSQRFYDQNNQVAPSVYVPISPVPAGGSKSGYAVIASGKFDDLETAKRQMSNLEGYGFSGMILPVEA